MQIAMISFSSTRYSKHMEIPPARSTYGQSTRLTTVARKHRKGVALRTHASSGKNGTSGSKVPFDPFGGGAGNPFAKDNSTPSASRTIGMKVKGFAAPGTDRSRLLPTSEAEVLLKRFDIDQRKAGGSYGKTTPGTPGCTYPPLKAAVFSMAAKSVNLMMGICAPDQHTGVRALKVWTESIGLPKGKLHGMDLNGKPVDVPGAVYIKYNSLSGDAVLSGYAGEYRGVLFTPELEDGGFRQYGYLPLDLLVDRRQDA